MKFILKFYNFLEPKKWLDDFTKFGASFALKKPVLNNTSHYVCIVQYIDSIMLDSINNKIVKATHWNSAAPAAGLAAAAAGPPCWAAAGALRRP